MQDMEVDYVVVIKDNPGGDQRYRWYVTGPGIPAGMGLLLPSFGAACECAAILKAAATDEAVFWDEFRALVTVNGEYLPRCAAAMEKLEQRVNGQSLFGEISKPQRIGLLLGYGRERGIIAAAHPGSGVPTFAVLANAVSAL